MVDIDRSSTASGISSWVTCIERTAAASSLSVGVKQNLDDALGKNADALFNLFESGSIDKVTDRVCCHLLSLYRTKESELCHYTMELVPAMIWSYLLAVSTNMKKTASGIEACLLALYNLEVVDDKGRPKVTVTTIPSLGRASVYHEPGSLGSPVLTESALSRYEQDDRKTFTGPFPVIEKCNAKNRHPVLSHLLRCYNAVVGQLAGRSHQSICDVAIRVSCAGFFPSSRSSSTRTAGPAAADQQQASDYERPASTATNKVSAYGSRITVSSELLVEMARGVYFALFNYDPALGLDALRCLQFRANHELYADAIMLIRAMINSVESSLSSAAASALSRKGQHGLRDVSSAMSTSLLLTPAFNLSGGGAGANKEVVITNASFRTQKLPDDIGVEPPQQQEQLAPAGGTLPLPEMTPLSEKKALGLSGLRLGPLKSALKKVERTISVRKDEGVATSTRKDDKETTAGGSSGTSGGFKDGKERADAVRTPKKAQVVAKAAASEIERDSESVGGSGGSGTGGGSAAPPPPGNDSPTLSSSGRPGSRPSSNYITLTALPLLSSTDADDDDNDEGAAAAAAAAAASRSAAAAAAASERIDASRPLAVDSIHVSWDDEDEWAVPTEGPPSDTGQPRRSAYGAARGGDVSKDDVANGTSVDGTAAAAPFGGLYRSASQV